MTVPSLVPDAPELIVIQSPRLTAVHAHPAGAFTDASEVPPPPPNTDVATVTAKLQLGASGAGLLASEQPASAANIRTQAALRGDFIG